MVRENEARRLIVSALFLKSDGLAMDADAWLAGSTRPTPIKDAI